MGTLPPLEVLVVEPPVEVVETVDEVVVCVEDENDEVEEVEEVVVPEFEVDR